tara:strand:- start:129 stop:683 length:555 start_codon:yes stop_codon:yes gene_type:complete
MFVYEHGLQYNKFMARIIFILDKTCLFGAVMACLACLFLASMLMFEVVASSFFSYSQPWAVEYSGYLLAIILFAGSGYTLSQGGHIRVNVILQFLNEQTFKKIDVLVTLFALLIALFATNALVENTLRSIELGSVSYYPTRTPIWMPQALLSLSWCLLCCGLTSRLLRLVFNLSKTEHIEGTVD